MKQQESTEQGVEQPPILAHSGAQWVTTPDGRVFEAVRIDISPTRFANTSEEVEIGGKVLSGLNGIRKEHPNFRTTAVLIVMMSQIGQLEMSATGRKVLLEKLSQHNNSPDIVGEEASGNLVCLVRGRTIRGNYQAGDQFSKTMGLSPTANPQSNPTWVATEART